MKKQVLILFMLSVLASNFCLAQAGNNDKSNKKRKTFGEMTSDLAGKLLTAKTDQLDNVSLTAGIVCGAYDMRAGTSSIKYYPAGTVEGDYVVGVVLQKATGTGLYQLKGEVLCDGEAMEYVGLGAYIKVYKTPITKPVTIKLKAELGDEASIVVKPIQEVELVAINGDKVLPMIDLNEDVSFEYNALSKDTNLIMRAGMLFELMGVREFNYFADFPQRNTRVVIPKEALSNTQVSGKLNAGQFNKGQNFFLLERVQKIPRAQLGPENNFGDLADVNINSSAYSSWPVIVKGKQEEGIIASVDFSGKFGNNIGFSISKPNAQSGIPFSRASKFGLASLSLKGELYKQTSKTSSSSYSIGSTRYTETRTVTTTMQFPQLPDANWDKVLDEFYKKFTAYFNTKQKVGFISVADVVATPNYTTVFKEFSLNTDTKIARNYQGTRRCNPADLSQILNRITSDKNPEPTGATVMQDLGIDGLVSLALNFQVGANKDNKIVLIPTVDFSIVGIDETKLNKKGTYATGRITFADGIPFNEQNLRTDPAALAKICNIDQIIACLDYMISNLQRKEQELGFDKIWSIGE